VRAQACHGVPSPSHKITSKLFVINVIVYGFRFAELPFELQTLRRISLRVVEEQRNYGTRKWLQMVIQLKLLIPAPDAVLVSSKLWPCDNGWPMSKREFSLSTFQLLSQ